jgi:hypothetical protein
VNGTDPPQPLWGPQEGDALEVLRATLATRDDIGPLVLEVGAWERNYGPYLRYAINVNAESEREETSRPSSDAHPFAQVRVAPDDGRLGNIVADNDVTRSLLRLIALSDDDLQRLCGNSSAPLYRAKLIGYLDRLWD